MIQFVYDNRRNKSPKPSILLPVSNIDLLEITSLDDKSVHFLYRVYATGVGVDLQDFDNFMQFESFEVPVKDVLQFCKENEIMPVQNKLKDRDIEEIKLKKNRIIIKYYSRWIPKRTILPISNITSVKLVSAHPISITNDYYLIQTSIGASYQFCHYNLKKDTIEQFCKVHNLPFSEEIPDNKRTFYEKF